MTADTAI